MANTMMSFDDTNFDQEVLRHAGLVLVDFSASWCGPCKVLTPIVEKLAEEYAGKIKVGKVDIDAAPKLAARYGIRSVPTVMVFDGGEKKSTHVGLVRREKLIEMAGL
jgi:thioredoxin 1